MVHLCMGTHLLVARMSCMCLFPAPSFLRVDALFCSARSFPDDEFLGEREKLPFDMNQEASSAPDRAEEMNKSTAVSESTTSKSSKEQSSDLGSPKASDAAATTNIKVSPSDVRSLPSGASWQSNAAEAGCREPPFGEYKWLTFKQVCTATNKHPPLRGVRSLQRVMVFSFENASALQGTPGAGRLFHGIE